MELRTRPDRGLGSRTRRATENSAQVVLGMMSVKQEPDRIWFQSPQNQTDNSDNTGYLASGRIDVWPIGRMPVVAKHPATLAFNPNDLHRTDGWHLLASVGGYGWWNNNANNPAAMACPTTNNNVCPDGSRTCSGPMAASQRRAARLRLHVRRRIPAHPERAPGPHVRRRPVPERHERLEQARRRRRLHDLLRTCSADASRPPLLTATNFPSSWYSNRVGLNWFIRDHTLRGPAEGTRNTNAFGTTGAHENIAASASAARLVASAWLRGDRHHEAAADDLGASCQRRVRFVEAGQHEQVRRLRVALDPAERVDAADAVDRGEGPNSELIGSPSGTETTQTWRPARGACSALAPARDRAGPAARAPRARHHDAPGDGTIRPGRARARSVPADV